MYLKKPTPNLTPSHSGIYKLDESYLKEENKTIETKVASRQELAMFAKTGSTAELPTDKTSEK